VVFSRADSCTDGSDFDYNTYGFHQTDWVKVRVDTLTTPSLTEGKRHIQFGAKYSKFVRRTLMAKKKAKKPAKKVAKKAAKRPARRGSKKKNGGGGGH